MSDYSACPNCGRTTKETLSSNWFPVYKCTKCGEYYCHECGDGAGGQTCPHCGGKTYTQVGKVYGK